MQPPCPGTVSWPEACSIFEGRAVRRFPLKEVKVQKLSLYRVLEVFLGVLVALLVYGFIGGSL